MDKTSHIGPLLRSADGDSRRLVFTENVVLESCGSGCDEEFAEKNAMVPAVFGTKGRCT